MRSISVISGQTTGLDPAFGAVRSLEVEDTLLGEGGFGVAYRACSFNGTKTTTPQVIKLLTENGQGVARRGFETIQELQRRLSAKNSELLRASGRSLLEQIPALQGVPQFSFEGQLEGRRVMGYSANDLNAAGMQDFGRILEDATRTQQFQRLPLPSRMRIAAQLVSAFHFLSTHLLFIHADIKAEALFVDPQRLRCAVIDFDSGALARDPSDTPTTFGAKQDWLAPEIVKQLDLPVNSARVIKVDLLSDIWSVNIAIHYLLFGFHPLFFLTEISDRSIGAYFRRFQWPDVAQDFPYFRREYAGVYGQYYAFLRGKLPTEVRQRLAFTINKGYLDPTARTTYGQWKTVLGVLNRPAIKHFTADRTFVTDARPVRLTWDVCGAARVEVTGIGDVTGRSSIDTSIRHDTVFTLVVTPDEGPQLTRSVRVEVSKAPPTIHSFVTSKTLLTDGTPARLTWKVTGAGRVEIDGGIGEVTRQSHVDVLPRREAVFTLTASSPFGVRASATVGIRVSTAPPTIEFFRSDRGLLNDSRPVELSWKVSADAHEVVLDGLGSVGKEGTVRIVQRRDTAYVLRATSFFGYSSQNHVEVLVSKEPPHIAGFAAKPLFVREGLETELSWRVIGADQVRIDPTIGPVPAEARLKVRLGREARFTLTAESHFGVSAVASLVVRLVRSTPLGDGTKLRPVATALQGARVGAGDRCSPSPPSVLQQGHSLSGGATQVPNRLSNGGTLEALSLLWGPSSAVDLNR